MIYGTGRALNMFLTALLLPLFTSFMSRSDYGVIGIVVTFITAVDVFITLGFDVAFSRFFFDNKDPHHRSKVVTHVFYVDFIYPAFVLGALIVFMPQISRLIMGAPGYTLYFDIGLASEFFINLSDLPYQLLRFEHRAWTFASFTIARVLIQAPLSVVLLAVFHMGPMGYLLANLITVVILNVGALPFYVPRLIRSWDWPLMRAMLDFAVPALFTGMSFYFLKLSDRFFLLHYQGKAQVGLYTVANALAQPLYVVGMAFRMAWPQWHYAYLDDEVAHKRMIARSSTYFLALNGLFLVIIGLYLPLGMHILLNHRFWSVGPTTFVLTLSVALYNLYFIFWVGCNVAKKNRMVPVITLVASARQRGPQHHPDTQVRHVGRRLDHRAGLLHPRGLHLLRVGPLVPHPLRVAAADHGAGRHHAHAGRGLGHRRRRGPQRLPCRCVNWCCASSSSRPPWRCSRSRCGPRASCRPRRAVCCALCPGACCAGPGRRWRWPARTAARWRCPPARAAAPRQAGADDDSYQRFVEETESEIEAEDMLELGKDEDTTG